MAKAKRPVEVLVLSDIHLGTFGCHARELLSYMQSIEPKMVVLNGDIVDAWQFSKWYWPGSHWNVVKHLVGWMSRDIPVIYITGNHDDVLRRFPDLQLGSFQLTDQLILELNGKSTWFFHGDVFDSSIQHARWLAKLGGKSYDALILLNRFINWLSKKMGKGPVSLSASIKNGVKQAVAFISNFEQFAAEHALKQGYETVVCGHIHQPADRIIHGSSGEVRYLNSGDWVENLSSLEFFQGEWHIYKHHQRTPESELEADFNSKRAPSKEELTPYLASMGFMGKAFASKPR